MNGRDLERIALPTYSYSYAEVETALAVALDVRAKHQRGALRGRLKHFQRLGLIDLKAKKGQRVDYTYAQAAQWLIALLMAETGLDPTLIVTSLRQNWKQIVSAVEQATSTDARSGEYAYLCLWPRVMSATFEEQQRAAVSIDVLFIRRLSEQVASNPDRWFSAINITRALHRLQTALPRRD
jgi:hypothetical protein